MVHTSLNHSTGHYMNSTSPTGLHGLPLWYQYPLCAGAPYGFIFYYGVKMFNLVVGAPCNFLVIWQIAIKKSDASTSDIFIFNLAVLDAYFCLMTPVELVNHLLLDDSRIWYFQRFAYGLKDLAVLFLVRLISTLQKEFSSHPLSAINKVTVTGDIMTELFTLESVRHSDRFLLKRSQMIQEYFWFLGPFKCIEHTEMPDISYMGKTKVNVFTDLLSQVCICLDRYTAVVHPVLFSGIRDNWIRTGICVAVWGLILAYAVSKCILGSKSVNSVFSGAILFTFTIMVFCNISIIWVLRRTVAGNAARHPVKQKALKMVLTVLAIIVVNYLPPVALMPFASYYTFVEFNCQIRTSVFSIMDLSCSIEPLLYLTKMEFMDGCRCRFTEKTQDVATWA